MNKIIDGFLSNISVVLGIFITIVGVGVAYGKIESKQMQNEQIINELKNDVREGEEKINESENINLQQSVILERVIKTLDKLEEKLDK